MGQVCSLWGHCGYESACFPATSRDISDVPAVCHTANWSVLYHQFLTASLLQASSLLNVHLQALPLPQTAELLLGTSLLGASCTDPSAVQHVPSDWRSSQCRHGVTIHFNMPRCQLQSVGLYGRLQTPSFQSLTNLASLHCLLTTLQFKLDRVNRVYGLKNLETWCSGKPSHRILACLPFLFKSTC
jgi:hypothetical protein